MTPISAPGSGGHLPLSRAGQLLVGEPMLSFFRRESHTWNRQKAYRLLDAGCGAGDVPIALVRWSRGSGYHIQIDAIDKNPFTIELARQRC